MDSEYVTRDQLSEDYVSRDQLWADMRQLSTDLKGELLYRPAEVVVTVDIGPLTSSMVIVLCVTFLAYLLTRALRGE